MSSPKPVDHFYGFTLAELLIALAILGVIATFTIPKVLTAQQNQGYNAAAHEAIATIAAAYGVYLNNSGGVSAGTTGGVLTQYMNYVSVDGSTPLDDIPTYNLNYTCGSGITCLRLHSGGTLFYNNTISFGGTATTNAIFFLFDPDSQRTGVTTDGPGKALAIYLYANGRITSVANLAAGTASSIGSISSNPDPSWFRW